MDSTVFERLLYEEESTTLDFKRDQYRFSKATDDDKSELLKDVIGFANAWRRTDAYILIGVEDVRGNVSNVVGISEADQLDDHALQQFVNNLTNRPVRFHYEAFRYQGKHIGVIRIEQQPRPIYLKRDYGKLLKEKVYVRRGSSTDPTKPASLEEVSLMGQSVGPQSAELVVEFADVTLDHSLGTKTCWDAEFCEIPPSSTIPLFGTDSGRGLPSSSFLMYGTSTNRQYYRELANFELVRRLYRPVRLLVTNSGQVAANDVRIEFSVPANAGVNLLYPSQVPQPPSRTTDGYNISLPRGYKAALQRSPGDVTIDKNDERLRVEIDCGDLQPGRRVWSEVIYVGVATTGDLMISGQVFAGNLPTPHDFTLIVTTNITRTKMTLSELRSLPEPD